jgi:uncharacterized OB-fold protein
MGSNVIPVRPDRDAAPQWRSANGKLLIQKCDPCDKTFYYPRVVCPYCLGSEVSWLECSGRGIIYSHSTMRRGDPYTIAYVTLDEGPQMMTNIVDCAPEDIAIGQLVSVVFKDIDGIATPMFRPDPT